MEKFEMILDSWKSIKDESQTSEKSLELVKQTVDNYKKQQRKLIFTNLFISVSFAFAFTVIALIWQAFPERTMYFYGSLIAMGMIMAVFLVLMWLGVQYRRYDPDSHTSKFVATAIKKIRIQNFILKWATPTFMVLLFMAFAFYYLDVFQAESLQFRIIAYGLTFAWILGLGFFTRKKRKSKIRRNNELVNYLQQWQQSEKESRI